MEKLTDLPNISTILEKEITQAGITLNKLRDMETETTLTRILTIGETACFSKHCASGDAIQEFHWCNLLPNSKEELRNLF